MRILIVDDELVSRTKLETLMAPIGKCHIADCGKKAIEIYRKTLSKGRGIDVVMLDIDMPDMQGEIVLKKIREIENYGPHRAAVVMVTAKSDQDHVLACLKSGCDEYIAKPFNQETIHNKLVSIGLLNASDMSQCNHTNQTDSIFKEISNALRAGLFKLPVQPKIAIQFRSMVSDKDDLSQLAKLLKQDMIISARLIQMSNSALYRGYGVIRTVEQAIGRLGLTETEHMVIALSNQQIFNIDHPKYKHAFENLWRHSLASAYAAELIAASLVVPLTIDPFCAGLFHDIGAMALLKIIAQMEARGHYGSGVDEVALSETIDSYHAVFGAKVLEMWGFDVAYSLTTMSHSNLYTAASLTNELCVVHFSNLIAKSMGFTSDGRDIEVDLVNTPSAKSLNLDASTIDELKNQISERMDQSVL